MTIQHILTASCLLLAAFSSAEAQACDLEARCSHCLRAGEGCGWCADENRQSLLAVGRCGPFSILDGDNCENLYPTVQRTAPIFKKVLQL
jgi:hypothetical protein